MATDLEKRIVEKKGNVRRIITAHRDGKSVIVDDSEILAQPFLGFELTELMEVVGTPTIPVEEGEYKKELTLRMPDPGGVRIRLAMLTPDEEFFRTYREKGVDPAEEWRNAFGDDFRMHTTDTVDCGIILSGELCMELDDGAEVLLKPGDVVVNCGTRHAWRNRSAQNCIAAFVCIGAKREAKVEKIVKDHLAAFNSHDIEKMASLWSEDIVLDDIGVGVINGKQELKRYVNEIFAAIPNVRKELKSFFVAGNQAVCEFVETGTQTGAIGKIPATGKSYTTKIAWIIEVRDGKINRLAPYHNMLDFLQQIGLMPEVPL
jgi:steroid delta-isomerase-like uncharacterized protein